MQHLLKPLIIAISLSTLLIVSCEKTIAPTTDIQLKEIVKLTTKETKIVDLNDFYTDGSILEKIKNKFGELKSSETELMTLNERNDIEFLTIPFVSENKHLYIYHSKNDNKFLPIILEDIFSKTVDNKVSGISYAKTIENEIIFKEEYSQNKRVSFMAYSPMTQELQNGRVADRGECYKCITDNYNKIKSGCESDPICDISCSVFSLSCKSIFLGSAVASCTSGSSTVCNPFY